MEEGYDILIDIPCDKTIIKNAILHLFGYNQNQVAIVDSFVGYLSEACENGSDVSPVVVAVNELKGDFHCRLSIDFTVNFEESLPYVDVKTAARTLCRFFHTIALISDDTPNPYRWILVDGEGEIGPVFLDGDSLDED